MADRPIIFSAPMVRALLDGSKTQTRRVLTAKSHVSPANSVQRVGAHWLACEYDRRWPLRLPYAPGDRLWVREACSFPQQWIDHADRAYIGHVFYPASADAPFPSSWPRKPDPDHCRLRPSIHMPRWASRLTLTVTDVRVQRVQDISNENAIAEGIEPHGHAFTGYGKQADVWMAPYDSFASLWNSIHGPGAWDANPWVAAITFTVRKGNIDHD